jgi:hypothetical protein
MTLVSFLWPLSYLRKRSSVDLIRPSVDYIATGTRVSDPDSLKTKLLGQDLSVKLLHTIKKKGNSYFWFGSTLILQNCIARGR